MHNFNVFVQYESPTTGQIVKTSMVTKADCPTDAGRIVKALARPNAKDGQVIVKKVKKVR